MNKLDDQFLKPHPRTVLWAKERTLCEACGNVLRINLSELRCTLQLQGTEKTAAMHASRNVYIYCIDARDPGAPCGPGGELFTEAVLAQPTPKLEN